MKKILYLLLSIIVLIFSSCTKKENTLTNRTKYIIFSNAYFWGESNNNAVLITDVTKIRSLEKMYDNDLTDLYKSGFDYQVHFFDENNDHLYTRTINSATDTYSQDNAELSPIIKDFAYTIEQNPTHYVYNLTVIRGLKSDSIIEVLKKAGFDSFLLSDQKEQHSSIKYFIQVLSKDSLEGIKLKMKKYTFIEDISKANNGFIYKE